MPLIRFLAVLPLILSLSIEAYGQFNNYRKYDYKWAAAFPNPVALNSKFEGAPLVILNEENFFKVSGVKSGFMKIYVESKQHIKYTNAEGVLSGARFDLPSSFDPILDRSDVPRGSADTAQRPKLFDVKVLFFAARIKKRNGTVVNADIDDEVVLDDRSYQLKSHRAYAHSLRFGGSRLENNNTYTYVFQIQNLEPGDELEVHYKYEIPYAQNWYLFNSNRVFYNGVYPKQAYSFTFNFNKKVGTTFLYNNGANPDKRFQEKENVTYIFKAENLPGCLDEINARPHLELPYFVYNLNPMDARFYYTSPYNMEEAPLPFWIYLLRLREQYTEYEQRRADPLIKDKQWKKVQSFMIVTTAGIPNANIFTRLNTLHNKIVDDFKYQKDGAFFAGKDKKLERLGDYTENETLREISRFKLYVKLLNHLNIPYNTMYFMDKRVAQMGLNFISSVVDNEYAFAVPRVNQQYYLYPKQSRCGYYGNELPFYWENTPALYIEFYSLWADKIAGLNFIKTHASNASENIRVCNIKADVDLNQQTLDCEAKVSLSGQFSTMTRNLYVFNYMDSTLNPLYGRKINYAFQPQDNDTLTPYSKSAVYPFKTNFRMNYSSADRMVRNDSRYQLSLDDLFPHIVENELDEAYRELRYYPDFQSQDLIKYFFVFSDSVKLLNKDELDVAISNSFGAYTITADQLNSTTIMIASEFRVTSEFVEANKIGDVVDINAAIRKLNQGVLVVQKGRVGLH